MQRFAIVGFGCAGVHALKAIRAAGCAAEVDVYGDTALPPYNPMLTTYYVKGAIPYEALFPFGGLEALRSELGFAFYGGCGVSRVDAPTRTVRLADGRERAYDKLLLSSGARALVPPVGDLPRERIFSMRSVEDAVRLREALAGGRIRRMLVVGASMVGIKLVELLLEQGVETVLSDLAQQIFPTAAYEGTSLRIEAGLRARGVALRLGVKTTAATERNGRAEVRFSDGRAETVDAVAVCIGTRSAVDYVPPEQVNIGRGILVDARMRTSADGIYAAGDCCEGGELSTGGTRAVGLWANAAQQGEIAGKNMAGLDAAFPGALLHNITHFMGMDFISFGDKTLPGERRVFLDRDGQYVEATVADGRVRCVNLLDLYQSSGAVKNAMLRGLYPHEAPPDAQMRAALLKGGLPRALAELLGGGMQ